MLLDPLVRMKRMKVNAAHCQRKSEGGSSRNNSTATASFKGGGTAFWPAQSQQGREDKKEADEICEVLLQPQQGMGVLFNGQLSHAGKRVTSGLRHVYVASFDLRKALTPS